MKKIKISKLEKRVVIFLMLLNTFALFVNYFGVSPMHTITVEDKQPEGHTLFYYNRIYFLTDSSQHHLHNFEDNTTYLNTDNMYRNNHPYHFWPFTTFKERHFTKPTYRFRGIFADFDHTEFLCYTLLIFGVVFIKKVW